MLGKQLDDGLVRLSLQGRFADVNRQLTATADLDERTRPAARFDSHRNDVSHGLKHGERAQNARH
jgi:hypothetical protein